MRIDDLILYLQRVRATHGNVDVLCESGDGIGEPVVSERSNSPIRTIQK